MKKYIDTSFFDLFKVGPGPSSSHTIGPIKAANDFVEKVSGLSRDKLDKAVRLEAWLYGSFASTGKGHGTDRAVAVGLLGEQPETCDIALLERLLQDEDEVYRPAVKGAPKLVFKREDIHFVDGEHDFPYQNTMVLKVLSGSSVLFEKTYYSIGGGFIICEGEKPEEREMPPYRYKNMESLRRIVEKYEIPLAELLLDNEKSLSGNSTEDIDKKLDFIIDNMICAVERGINTEGILPGPIGLQRKAKEFFERSNALENIPDRFLGMLDAFTLAASEENAAGHMVVTAPTSGSAGVLPGIIYFLKNYQKVSDEKMRAGLMIAAAIGFIVRHNASISGAEVGCQGEVGVASAMAAALLAYVNNCDFDRIECAAEIALEHHLGMTCDPVGGYVQIPCIERNAFGAITAYNAYLVASVGDPKMQKVSFDEVVEAMLETGRQMPCAFKETSRGGLAVCSICG
ncbi:L-serine ammonia-lyase [Lentisphaerota bacterium ZTH]|nr:L-serine ammonia-lyase [Lentisphaerota bacterium]WET07596.1 L-serine ammonia-lyase [Lentisphaerota bacterium ZTH]